MAEKKTCSYVSRYLFLILFVFSGTSACAPRTMVVRNDCVGSWIQIKDGEGRVLNPRINYGKSGNIELFGSAGSQVQLIAEGYDLARGTPLGSTTRSIYIPRSEWMTTAPQIEPWRVDNLQTTDPNGGCRRR